jgi:hypothetical protein
MVLLWMLLPSSMKNILSFGVADVELQDGTVQGIHTKTFDYSAKNLITITAEKNIIREEIRCVRPLKSGGQWIEMIQRLP